MQSTQSPIACFPLVALVGIGGLGMGCSEGGTPMCTVLSGCAGGQVGEEPARCRVQTVRELSRGEVTPLGFRLDDLIQSIEGERTTAVRWADEQIATFSLTLGAARDARFLERDWNESTPREIHRTGCDDIVELTATVAISTDDGRLDLEEMRPLQAEDGDSAQLLFPLDPAGVPSSLVPEGMWEDVSSSIELTVGSGAPTGTISGSVTSAEGSRDVDVVSSDGFEIAWIGPGDG